jgi:MSHA biogenesis protein MshP
MCPESHPLPGNASRGGARRQRGLGLITAIALITVVAVVLGALVRTLASSAALDSVDALSTRSMLAAESGMDVALNRAYAPSGTPSCTTRTWTFDAEGLRGCEVTVTCAPVSMGGRNYFDLSSRAACGSGDLQASRRIDARAIAP